ncbi:MAG: sulfotransferase family 2 domain-containing protein [Roseibium sp.]|nr:sulfotransferase family 2 domain-containing protein [Roseibium sp.]
MDEFDLRNGLKFFPQLAGFGKDRKLFVHIPKNGGMAIRQAAEQAGNVTIANRKRLVSRNYADALKDSMAAARAHPGYEHARLRDINIWVRRSHTPFAVVRNPWSRVLSRFLFAIQTRNWDFESTCTLEHFERFLEERHEWANMEFSWHRAVRGWHPQIEYLVDEDGKVISDVLRQERLGQDTKQYFGLAGDLERVNVTKGARVDYRSFYSPKAIQIVADWYASDIEYFGFDFDSMATRKTLYA